MNNLQTIYDKLLSTIKTELGGLSELFVDDKYKRFTYPKLIPLMKFTTNSYEVKDTCRLFSMMTESFFMNLMTISITPFSNVCMPYTLIDVMSTKNKIVVFIEFYNCTEVDLSTYHFIGIKRYADLNCKKYNEKRAWYTDLREDYSIIIEADSIERANSIIQMSIKNLCKSIVVDINADNTERLINLRNRFICEGTPATGTLLKVFNKDDIVDFYSKLIMPIVRKDLLHYD